MSIPDHDYAHPELLVTPAALADRLREAELEGREPPLLLDGRAAECYAAGHIAASVHVDLWGVSLIDTDPGPLRAFLWMVHHVLALRGVRADRPAVLVDQYSGLRAARGFWFLEFFGHRQVSVLDGGVDAWIGAGLPLTSAADPPVPSTWDESHRTELLASRTDVAALLDHCRAVLLDARTAEEHDGRLARARRAGAIPGSVHVEWTRNLAPDGRFLPAAELRSLYESAGVTPDREVVTYCQGAYRAAHSYLALRLLGYPRVRVYLGSWKEWGDRDDTPVALPQ